MEKSFGIGCFHFGLKGELPINFQGTQYLESITRSLNNIPNITNVEVDIENGIHECDQILNELPRLSEGEEYFPNLPDLKISFNLYIPYRIQTELYGVEQRFLNTNTENFKIIIKYAWYLSLIHI